MHLWENLKDEEKKKNFKFTEYNMQKYTRYKYIRETPLKYGF